MRKKILLALLAVALLVAGLAGGAYAAGSHKPVQGNKLVGCGALGTKGEYPPGPILKDSSMFTFTNPDCVNNITIDRVSIVDGGGTVIYEGPYLHILWPDGTRVPRPVLKPHRVGKIELWNWMYLGGDVSLPENWRPEGEARDLPVAAYTVEIGWRAKKGTCPLMGYGMRTHISIMPPEPGRMVSHYIPMVNMKGHSR